jgi:hypothetical protein
MQPDFAPFPANMVLKMQIVALEKTQMRAIREAILGLPSAVSRLQDLDNQIAALRAQLTPE